MTFDEFIAAYERKLNEEAIVTIRFAPRSAHPGEPKAAADGFVRSLGMSPLGERWTDLDWDIPNHANPHCGHPEGHLAAQVERTLVGGSAWFTPEAARQFAHDFYGMFANGKTVRLTNTRTVRLQSGVIASGGNPITKSTFEAAFIAIDDENIGVICLETKTEASSV